MTAPDHSPPSAAGRVAMLIVAAGKGLRAGGGVPKQYRQIGGTPVLRRTIEAALACDRVSAVAVLIGENDDAHYADCIAGLADPRLQPPARGGDTRQATVLNGLRALEHLAPDIVLIHDGARPFVSIEVMNAAIDAIAAGHRAAVAAVPVSDTLKRADPESGAILGTVERSGLYAAQTPQAFRFSDILDAHERAASEGLASFTDDAAVAEWAGLAVVLTPGEAGNVKITTAEDLRRFDRDSATREPRMDMETRVATAYDVHAFEAGNGVVLGGIAIPHDRALMGHSDADVVLHALTDAVLATICDGDIGHHFPPSDPQWRGAASDQFLDYAVDRLRQRGGRISHLDVTIVCERPKIGPHREAMRARIAEICGTPLHRVSVKATTSERLGFTGREEGIAALATATVRLPEQNDDITAQGGHA
ncbi:bifunctional 2-C-methyl-D-erythritol 4-phosphate cytidylyltransferase/2-C-methyl-D-erythritol 2,4-cyclodiphosphate synthase [Stappia indica]|nr:bifunctional 2-C-methyl-D-erythritol 4-phosphate cytidylyltransferase/2-C-methyl-D-erythritol 2,4-cyclodiphosphate synthase [Stappia indica]